MEIPVKPMYDTTAGTWDSKGSIPEGIDGTGTIESDIAVTGLRVVGTGTEFLTEVRRGYYLYGVTTQALARVDAVINDELLLLEAEPVLDYSGESFKIVKRQYKAVTITNIGAGNGWVNLREVEPSQESLEFRTDSFTGLLEPITYDTGEVTTFAITVIT